MVRLEASTIEVALDVWLAPFRKLWSAHLDALERHLDRLAQPTAPKKKTRKRK